MKYINCNEIKLQDNLIKCTLSSFSSLKGQQPAQRASEDALERTKD